MLRRSQKCQPGGLAQGKWFLKTVSSHGLPTFRHWYQASLGAHQCQRSPSNDAHICFFTGTGSRVRFQLRRRTSNSLGTDKTDGPAQSSGLLRDKYSSTYSIFLCFIPSACCVSPKHEAHAYSESWETRTATRYLRATHHHSFR